MFRKFFTIIGTVGILVGVVALIGVMGALRPKPERQEPVIAPPAVFFTLARPQAVTLDVGAQGEVRPRTDISLTAQVAGQVVSLSDDFVDGGAFEAGDTLIKIEDAPYRATAAAAKARLAQEQAEATLARKDYEDLGRDEDPTELTLRVPQLAQAEAEYRAAELNLERTTIKAPFKGRVRERIVGVGQYVAPGAQLGRIFSTDVAEIRLPLTDNDLAKLGLPIAFVESPGAPGPRVEMTATIANKIHTWVGRIARTDGAIDAATRQVIAIAVVDDPYGAGAADGTPLAMGLFVDAVIRGKPYDDAIVLPRSALYGRDTVYTIADDDTLVEHKVEIVSTDRDSIIVAGGLSAGDRVVISPLRGAGAGNKVSPSDPLTETPGSSKSDEPRPTASAANNNSGE
ncbi:MAG: efflux RND transporter periplasmic adaptor subunit [Parvularculaceae bacterium]